MVSKADTKAIVPKTDVMLLTASPKVISKSPPKICSNHQDRIPKLHSFSYHISNPIQTLKSSSPPYQSLQNPLNQPPNHLQPRIMINIHLRHTQAYSFLTPKKYPHSPHTPREPQPSPTWYISQWGDTGINDIKA